MGKGKVQECFLILIFLVKTKPPVIILIKNFTLKNFALATFCKILVGCVY